MAPHFHYMINNDEKMLAALKATNEFLALRPEAETRITSCMVIHRILEDLIPLTYKNLGLGHGFPMQEGSVDLECSITLAKLGYYKHGVSSLRTYFELSLLSACWDADGKENEMFAKWVKSKKGTPSIKKVTAQLKKNANVIEFEKTKDVVRVAQKHFQRLCGYTHTEGSRHSQLGRTGSNIIGFRENLFMGWLNLLEESVKISAILHVLKHPIAMQAIPLDEKFGMNFPSGGFIFP